MALSPSPRARSRSARIAERDRTLLAFAAEHRFITAAQAAAVLRVAIRTAHERLRRLHGAGLLHEPEYRVVGEPACQRITRDGLRAIGSDLPPPRRVYPSSVRHDRGLAWLMLAAQEGCFGPVERVVSERRMRSEDGRERDGDARHGVRLGGTGPSGLESLHYPDMVLVTGDRRRVAFELELTTKSRDARERILAGYGSDRAVDLVVYLVETAAAGRAVRSSAARLGIGHLVRVQRVALERPARAAAAGRAPHRPHRRARRAERGGAGVDPRSL